MRHIYIKKCKNEYIIRNLSYTPSLDIVVYDTKLYYSLENVSAESLYEGGSANGTSLISHLKCSYKRKKETKANPKVRHYDLLETGYRAVPIDEYMYSNLFNFN